MTDEDWAENSEPATPAKRKGPPGWMLGCGCGCVIPGFLLIAIVAWGMQYFGTSSNPRLAYAALAAVLPFDEALKGTPTGLADDPSTRALESHEDPEFPLIFGAEIPFSGGLSQFYLPRGVNVVDAKMSFTENALIAIITRAKPEQAESIASGGPGTGARDSFSIDIQGLTLSGVRIPDMENELIVGFVEGREPVVGPGIVLTLRTEMPEYPDEEDSKLFNVVLSMQRPQSDGAPISDEEIRHFLAPFHVGPER